MNIFTIKKTGLLLSLVIITASCGGDIGGGGGGEGDIDKTGIYLNVDSIVPRNITEEDTSSIDMTWSTECDGDLTTSDPETFGAHDATVTLSATPMEGVEFTDDAWVQITKYRVDFTVNPGYSGPAFPSIEYTTTIKVNVGSTTETTVNLMTEELKKPYVPELGGTTTWTYGWPVYTATYTFYGENKYGDEVKATGFKEVTIGGFNNCGQAES